MSDSQSNPTSHPARFSPAKIGDLVPASLRVFSPAKIPALLPLLVALLGLFILLAPRMLRVNVTPSVPLGIYRIVKGPADRGSLVEICPPPGLTSLALNRGYIGHGPCPGKARPLLKEILGVQGDRIVLTRIGVIRGGILFRSSAPRMTDSEGRPLPHLRLGVW